MLLVVLVWNEALLCIRKVQLSPQKFQEIQQNLEKSPANPIKPVDVKTLVELG